MKERKRRLLAALMTAAFLGMAAPTIVAAQDSGEYLVTFNGMWTAATHPLEYPKGNLITGAHFGPGLLVSHNGQFSSFKEGMAPSAGLEKQSETGNPGGLKEEAEAAVKAGNVGSVSLLDKLKETASTVTGSIMVDAKHPWVSMSAMIAPSPDWFAGASVNLMENGKWVAEKTVDVLAWDSGGDDGMTYKADDKDTNPKKPTSMAMTQHFMKDGKMNPVAKITFKRK